MSSELTLDGLPVVGDIRMPYLVIQRSRDGKQWDTMAQRKYIVDCYNAIPQLDLMRPVHICRVDDNGTLEVIRTFR